MSTPASHPITISTAAGLAESEAAQALASRLGTAVVKNDQAGGGFNLALATHGWITPPGSADLKQWIWLRLRADGSGELIATQGSFLFTGLRLLETGLTDDLRAKLDEGLLLPASFSMHRPHYDATLTQYWRSARGLDDEAHMRALAENGFTHCEVNALQAHFPYEESIEAEYYPQFYTYCAGFNHFVDSELTRGLWPSHYLEANLNRLKHLGNLARRYGLKPGVLMFEPRTLPEKFFTKYPMLRGARVDHPFRSRLPRYCLAQDHPITKRHYREVTERLMEAVPELDYMSVWSNDSGAGFEHTASLYVGRNGGPYMIREWREPEQIAEVAGQSIIDYMENIRSAAAKTNPDFDVILRLEPFKVEHDVIKSRLGGHLGWEGPSMLVHGYDLPYPHPKYPENLGVAGSVLHHWMDASEGPALAESQAQGVDPVLNYSASGLMNHEPLLGMPFPRLLHAKITALREIGTNRASCFGGLPHVTGAPYWPNPVAIQAAQFMPEQSIDTILLQYAEQLVGKDFAPTLDAAWREFEDALIWQPGVPLYTFIGFCWQRAWDRPFVPDIEAVPAKDREYYERFGCFQHNNPGLNDLGKDVLFDLISQEQGAKMSTDMQRELIPRLRKLIGSLNDTLGKIGTDSTDQTAAVFRDLRDRVRGYLHWAVALHNVCAWCANVYGYLDTEDEAERKTFFDQLQATIDLDLVNTQELLDLIETTDTEFMVVSELGNHTFIYGEDLPDLLRRRLKLTAQYRHHPPRIDREIMWRPVPGTSWPKGWL
ncbi:hypothetical protein [Synoicihabitans lomoniglobus]|uniref:Uncharacterized protein n=1 Tax=Synoicihabitans lomoniglobus TaxID=2909285 RepID=A0AAF0I7S0_9BACT|nr:hypothetical protein [Opitutaceae bacterium LMO-M01]WED66961.1 hypothetical protein PXH66_08875 [Opitutaceae bacterium LMO-M01]